MGKFIEQGIIAIGGISRSGKSNLAKELRGQYLTEGLRAVVFSQDDYVLPPEAIPRIQDHIDWETPASIDWGLWDQTLLEAREGYDVVIAEGLFVFWEELQKKTFDYRIFISLSEAEFVRRKKLDLRWGLEPDWYIAYVWARFLKYGQMPEGLQADLILDGEHPELWGF